MKKVIDIFAKAKLPAVLCVASGGGEAADEITFTKRIDKTTEGKKITVLSNLVDMKSPITGESVANETAAMVETASLNREKTLSSFVCIASCTSCNHDTYVVPDVAAALDAYKMHCSNCGDEVVAYYDDDLVVASDDEDTTDDDSDDVTDALAEDVDEDDSDEDAEGSEDDETADADADATSDDAGDDATDETTDADDATDDDAEDTDTTDSDDADDSDMVEVEEDEDDGAADTSSTETETPPVAETTETPSDVTMVVPSLTVASYDGATLHLASLSNAARYEAFLGETHIGSLIKEESSEFVQSKFTKTDLVRNAFATTFWKHTKEIASGNVESLKDYGFKAATLTVAVDNLVQSQIAEATAEAEAKSAEAITDAVDSVVASMTVAMAGLNKKVFSGNGTSLYTEVAKLLSGFGVQKAEEASARFTENFSAAYFKDVVETAAALRTKSVEYVSGMAATIETASFPKPTGVKAEDAYLSTSATLPRQTTKQPATDVPVTKHVEEASASTAFTSARKAFARMGNR